MNLSIPANENNVNIEKNNHCQANITLDNADLIIDYLTMLKVEYVFGVPGGAIEPLYNALARRRNPNAPKAVIARHETGAAFMAEGYARETGKLGVCCSTTGPGSTNLITGVASAYADNVSLLVITAQTPLPKFGKNALQESSCTAIDTVAMFRKCTRYSTLVSHSEQMSTKIIAALMAANQTPNGPAHLSIPSDILRQSALDAPQSSIERLTQVGTFTDVEGVEKLTQMMANSWRIALFLGKGCGPAIDEIMTFSNLTYAPIVTGPAGKRWVDSFHMRYRGVYGFAGHESAQQTLEDSEIDLVIAVGAPITELGTGGWQQDLLDGRLVHIDTTPEHFSRTPMAQHHVCGDLNAIFKQLNSNIRQGLKWGRSWDAVDVIQNRNNQQNKVADKSYHHGNQITLNDEDACYNDAMPLKPQRVVTVFSQYIPAHFRLHVDAGNAWAWFTHYFHRKQSQGNYHIAMGFGSMGWAIGAAIGSTLGSKQPSVCVTGDGSYLMSGQEITVALQHQIPVIYVVLNDGVLGMVKHGQKLGGAEEIGFDLPTVNYAALAEAMGIEGITIQSPEELLAIDWQRLGEKKAPTMINLMIDGEEVPPMGQRVKGLADSQSATPGG